MYMHVYMYMRGHRRSSRGILYYFQSVISAEGLPSKDANGMRVVVLIHSVLGCMYIHVHVCVHVCVLQVKVIPTVK